MKDQVRAAVVQAGPVLFDKEATVEKTVLLTRRAADQGAGLILFPESFIPAHPRCLDFGPFSGRPSAEKARLSQFVREQAVAAEDPLMGKLSLAAAETGVYLAVGVTERDGDHLYSSLFFWGPNGAFLGRDRKIKLTGSERQIWSQGDFNILTILDTLHGKTGTILSGENYLPLMRAAMYARGVSLYLAPTSESDSLWQCTVRHIAAEGQCFVLSCNQYLAGEMAPPSAGADRLAAGTEAGPICQGGSAIVGPDGAYLAGPLFGEEGILTADLNFGAIVEARQRFDPADHFGPRMDVPSSKPVRTPQA